MGQGPHVLHNVMLWTQDRADPVGRVVDPQLHRHGPFQHRANALTEPSGRLRLRVPDGSEDLQHIGARDLRHRHLPDTWEGVPLEGQDPLAAVRPTSLAGLLLFHHMCGGFGEAWHALRTTFLCERVATLAGQLAVGQGLLPSLGERDQRDPAEPELAAPAVCLPGGRLSRDRRSVRAKRGPVEHQLRPRHRSLLTNL